MLWIVYWFWPNFQGLIPIRTRFKYSFREYAWGSTYIVATLPWKWKFVHSIVIVTDGHPERAFSLKTPNFWAWKWKWKGILGIFGQTTVPILSLWVPCPWFWLFVWFFLQLWISGLKHINVIAIIRPSSMIVIKMILQYLFFCLILFMWKSCHLISNSGTGIFSSLATCTTIRGHSITTWAWFCTFTTT